MEIRARYDGNFLHVAGITFVTRLTASGEKRNDAGEAYHGQASHCSVGEDHCSPIIGVKAPADSFAVIFRDVGRQFGNCVFFQFEASQDATAAAPRSHLAYVFSPAKAGWEFRRRPYGTPEDLGPRLPSAEALG